MPVICKGLDENLVLRAKLTRSCHTSIQISQGKHQVAAFRHSKVLPDILQEGLPAVVGVSLQRNDGEQVGPSFANENPFLDRLSQMQLWRWQDRWLPMNWKVLWRWQRRFQLAYLKIKPFAALALSIDLLTSKLAFRAQM